MAKFKLGDKVRVVDCLDGPEAALKEFGHAIYTIADVNFKRQVVDKGRLLPYMLSPAPPGARRYFAASHLEAVLPTFKKGDKVKFKKYNHHEYIYHRGEVATVLKQYPESGNWAVEWANGTKSEAWASENYWGMHLAHPDVERIFNKFRKEVERGQ